MTLPVVLAGFGRLFRESLTEALKALQRFDGSYTMMLGGIAMVRALAARAE